MPPPRPPPPSPLTLERRPRRSRRTGIRHYGTGCKHNLIKNEMALNRPAVTNQTWDLKLLNEYIPSRCGFWARLDAKWPQTSNLTSLLKSTALFTTLHICSKSTNVWKIRSIMDHLQTDGFATGNNRYTRILSEQASQIVNQVIKTVLHVQARILHAPSKHSPKVDGGLVSVKSRRCLSVWCHVEESRCRVTHWVKLLMCSLLWEKIIFLWWKKSLNK